MFVEFYTISSKLNLQEQGYPCVSLLNLAFSNIHVVQYVNPFFVATLSHP